MTSENSCPRKLNAGWGGGGGGKTDICHIFLRDQLHAGDTPHRQLLCRATNEER